MTQLLLHGSRNRAKAYIHSMHKAKTRFSTDTFLLTSCK